VSAPNAAVIYARIAETVMIAEQTRVHYAESIALIAAVLIFV